MTTITFNNNKQVKFNEEKVVKTAEAVGTVAKKLFKFGIAAGVGAFYGAKQGVQAMKESSEQITINK